MTIASRPARGYLEVGLFRAVLGRQAASVVVITAPALQPVGFTASSFVSVSTKPPLVSFNVDRASSSWPALVAAGHVGVHVLGHHQEHIARRFATQDIDRFAGTVWHRGPYGVPLMADVPAWLIARVARLIPAGDHTIVLAEPVLGGHTDEEIPPLVYHMGGYRSLT